MRVLVCGGRKFGEPSVTRGEGPEAIEKDRERCRAIRAFVFKTLDDLHAGVGPITALIHGNAAGADALGRAWAYMARVPEKAFQAKWRQEGKAAGPIRNQRMINEGLPDVVVAFPGGAGTANMIALAKTRGIRIIEVPYVAS